MTLGPASSPAEIVRHLESLRNDANLAGMARYGIDTYTALGITTPQIQSVARQVKRDHARALLLRLTGLRDARMVAILTADPSMLTREEAREWAADFNSWEIVDTAAGLFAGTSFWRDLIAEFAADERANRDSRSAGMSAPSSARTAVAHRSAVNPGASAKASAARAARAGVPSTLGSRFR